MKDFLYVARGRRAAFVVVMLAGLAELSSLTIKTKNIKELILLFNNL